jgi:type IV pilus assembly protein PilC
MDGILLVAEQTENKNLAAALSNIHEQMDQGHTFAQAIARHPNIFGNYFINMVSLGELSGTLDTTFELLYSYFDKEDKIRRKLRSATAYPVVLTGLMAVIVLLLILKILPMFENTLSSLGGEMPTATNLIFKAADFVSKFAAPIFFAVVIIIIACVIYARAQSGRAFFDKLKVVVPLVRYVNVRVITSRYARSLAVLLKSGVQLINALEEIIPLTENTYLENKFKKAQDTIKDDSDFVDTLNNVGIFPPLFIRMVRVGHATGRLDDMLDKSASLFDDEVDGAVERITLMVEPALIILLSLVVGVILLSVMLPMISIMNAII